MSDSAFLMDLIDAKTQVLEDEIEAMKTLYSFNIRECYQEIEGLKSEIQTLQSYCAPLESMISGLEERLFQLEIRS